MVQFYKCFIKNFASIMAPIIKLTRKTKKKLWTKECQKAWELIKQKYIEALILIPSNWDMEFHVHTYALVLDVGAFLAHNITRKSDQLVVYVFKLLNSAKLNYNIRKREALVMIFTLHKFKHYLLGNKFVFYVDHMALVYLVNKRLLRWLLLFLEYDFIVVYKPCKIHVVANVLSKLPNTKKPRGVQE